MYHLKRVSMATYLSSLLINIISEKFDQAIVDYEAGLTLKTELLPTSSRQIAEAHYKLSMVLDLTSGRLADAIVHAAKALESVESRLKELGDGLSGQLPPAPEAKASLKGKEKATGTRLVRDDLVQNMSKTQIEAEIKELSGLKEDLALKVRNVYLDTDHSPHPNCTGRGAEN
jgi:HAT1-interacting factor 1